MSCQRWARYHSDRVRGAARFEPFAALGRPRDAVAQHAREQYHPRPAFLASAVGSNTTPHERHARSTTERRFLVSQHAREQNRAPGRGSGLEHVSTAHFIPCL